VTALVVDDRAYLDHAPGNWPEGPFRLEAAWTVLKESGVREALEFHKPTPATVEEAGLVHTLRHLDRVRRLAEAGGGYLTLDTVVSRESYRVALLALGGATAAVDAVLDGRSRRAAALVRPPGHHATPAEGMGFCLFNNVAVAAAYALRRRGLERVLILDWDLHHGNGTEAAFYERNDVLYISLHESPAYPGTGWVTDTGSGEGEGFTVNVPLPHGSGDEAYLLAFEDTVEPVVRAFNPELVLVSAGFDGHYLDPIGHLALTSTGYGLLSERVCALADSVAGGEVVFVLEGGYHEIGLGWSLASTLNVAAGRGGPLAEPEPWRGEPAVCDLDLVRRRLARVREVQASHWPL